jgi:predicted glycosyltransferase
MKILIDVNHPAHVHFFKNFIRVMMNKGHDIVITASSKDITLQLLDLYLLPYYNIGSYGDTLKSKLFNIPRLDINLYKIAQLEQPDLLLGVGSIRAAHVATLMRKPSFSFDDTEISGQQQLLYIPFITNVFTPTSYLNNLGPKQIRYKGYHQLAFLHPKWFKPSEIVLEKLGLRKGDTIVTTRFVAWNATHDLGQHGITNIIGFIKELEHYGSVFISSEKTLPPRLEKFRFPLPPFFFHDLLYYSSLYIGDGGSTALEAATLGTPSILVDTSAKHCGIIRELGSYELLYYYDDQNDAFQKVNDLLINHSIDKKGCENRNTLLKTHMDVTSFLVWMIEEYPNSIQMIRETPDIQKRFIFLK